MNNDTEKNDVSKDFSLEEIILMFWKYRRMIIIINLIFIVGSISYSLIADEIYEVKCTIRPAQPSEEVTLLESSFFTQFSFVSGKMELPVAKEISSYLYSYPFLQKYYDKYKDKENSIFDDKLLKIKNSGYEQTIKEERIFNAAMKILKDDIIKIYDDGFIMTITIRLKDKYLAKEFLIELTEDLKNYIQNKNKSILQSQITFYEEVLKSTTDPNIILVLQNTINKKLEKSCLISTNIFQIVEDPVIPSKRFWPKRSAIVIASSLFGFIFSFFFVTVYSYFLDIYERILHKKQKLT